MLRDVKAMRRPQGLRSGACGLDSSLSTLFTELFFFFRLKVDVCVLEHGLDVKLCAGAFRPRHRLVFMLLLAGRRWPLNKHWNVFIIHKPVTFTLGLHLIR